MDGVEGTSKIDAADGVRCEQSKAVNNGVENGSNDGNVSSEASEHMLLHKRSELGGSSSVSKGLEDGNCSGEAASKLADKEPYVCDEEKCKPLLQTAALPNGVHHVAVIGNGAGDKSHCKGGTDICWHAFRHIIVSEKFTSLSKLLLENFQGMKPDNCFSLTQINTKLEEGAYESTPALFLTDTEQVWTKLQGIGAELIFLAKSLSDMSRACFDQKVRSSAHCTSPDEKNEFGGQESVSHQKSEHPESFDTHTCRQCGHGADGKNCLVCNSCKEMYHVSCVEPSFKEIHPKSWYCNSCVARDTGSPHEDCVICERLNVLNTQCNQAGYETSEEASKNNTENGVQPSKISENSSFCKLCKIEVHNGEDLRVCEHSLCPNKYYHVRCLTSKQLKAYGPRWYCPSCLCRACLIDKDDDNIVLCDSCDHAYHIYCMNPPRTSIPRGKWFCRKCAFKIRKIRRARKSCGEYEIKMKKKRKMMHETPDNKHNQKAEKDEKKHKEKSEEEEKPDGSREGMDMLLNAALNYEEKLASNQASSSLELKNT